jgi:hypothetical protein
MKMEGRMTRPRGGITRNLLDRQWPHQVALSAEALRGAGHSTAIYGLAKTLAGTLPPHHMERDSRDLVVFCFNRPEAAQTFAERFRGEIMRWQAGQ